MKASELRNMSVEELHQQIVQLQTADFGNRFSLKSNQMEKTHVVRQTRRDIARAMTILNEKLRAQSEE